MTTGSPIPSNALERLRATRGFIFDMDGVLYRGNEQCPGVADLLSGLAIRDKSYVLATNNSMSTPQMYVEKLGKMGIESRPEQILTSAIATRLHLQNVLPDGAKIHVVGMPALATQLFEGTTWQQVEAPAVQPDAIVIGLDLQFTYAKLKAAAMAIRAGALFIATNADATLPTEEGLVPGAGSIVAALRTASGVAPTIIGKPEPASLLLSAANLGLDPSECVMIGDRLDTDILAGKRAGMLTALVLTGVSTRDEIATAEAMPDLVFTDLTAMLDVLSRD